MPNCVNVYRLALLRMLVKASARLAKISAKLAKISAKLVRVSAKYDWPGKPLRALRKPKSSLSHDAISVAATCLSLACRSRKGNFRGALN
jgi:hypothetical protein